MEKTLDAWLEYQLSTHPNAIAMGLERVRSVAERLQILAMPCPVITVAGTNGKGSTVAFIEAIARAAGYRVGAFTSPHFLRYNERIRIDGEDAADEALVMAFEAIEAARGDIPLTYFEFGTLAALYLFKQATPDLVVLEVGLGGRLDAVNIVDADVAVITTVDLDHQAYLGNDREAIGLEKAGIMRAGKPCILGEKDPPSSVLGHAYRNGVFCVRAYSDYLIEKHQDHWCWREPGFSLELPLPSLAAPIQLQNAACAVAALRASPLKIAKAHWSAGVAQAKVTGRMQLWRQQPEVVLDVAHNPQSVAQLAAWLKVNPMQSVAVFSALADKDITAMLDEMRPYIDFWYVGQLQEPKDRVLSPEQWQTCLSLQAPELPHRLYPDVVSAYRAALHENSGQRIVCFGSFHTLEAVMRCPEP